MADSSLTFVDLFAGAGGLSAGLERVGFDLQTAVEVNDDARQTYAQNRSGISADAMGTDIRDIKTAEITELVGQETVDLIAGGPPCQGFSEVVSPDGSDDRNHLFEYFIDWVDELRPRAAIFENVRGIQKTAGGKFLDAVEESFRNLGYQITSRVVRACDFGVPQLRRRLLVIAWCGEEPEYPFDGYELDPIALPGVMDGIGDLAVVEAGDTQSTYRSAPTTVLQQDLRGDSQSVTHHTAPNHTDDLLEILSHLPKDGGDRSELPEEHQPSSGYHNTYSRLAADDPAVAITSNMSKPSSQRCVHPFQDRGLTPREGARLQTFPDAYEFHGKLQSIRQQIGNAVPPYLAEAIGYYLRQAVFFEELSEEDQERIATLRSAGLSLEEYQEATVGGFVQQATLDI